MGKRIFFDEHIAFIRDNAKGIGNAELTERVNKHFGTSFTIRQIRTIKNHCGVRSGLTGYFKKGSIPKNKGKEMSKEQYETCKKNFFKKGHETYNKLPIGSERLFKGEYIYVKVDDQINTKLNVNWKPKHHIVWEQHYGKVPKGHVVIFLDRNKLNFDINNLMCVNKKELLEMSRKKLIFEDKDLTKVGYAIAKLNVATHEKKKKK